MSTSSTKRRSTPAARPSSKMSSIKMQGGLHLAPPPVKRVSVAVERGDLLAIPLCILWGISVWFWPFGGVGLPGLGSLANPLSFLWEVPLTLARYLFGW